MELLVAMSLMVVASACLYSSLYTGFKAKETADKILKPIQSAKIALDMVKRDLRGAVVGPDEDPNILAGPFIGENDQSGTSIDTDVLTFYTNNHEIKGDTDRVTCGIGKIEFSLIKPLNSNEDTFNLVRLVTDNILNEDKEEPVEEVLCRHARSLNFRYYDGLRWYDGWDSTEEMDALPIAVEVTLELEPYVEVGKETPKKKTTMSRYDQDYLDSLTRLTQVFILPRASTMEAVEASAEAAEAAAEAASEDASGNPGGQGGATPGGGAMP